MYGHTNFCLRIDLLRFFAWDYMPLWLLTLPSADRETIRVCISNPLCNFESGSKHQLYVQSLKNRQILALSFQLAYPACIRKYDGSGDSHPLRLAEVRSEIGRFTALRSLAVVIEADKPVGRTRYTPTDPIIPETECAMPSLREVHLDLPMKRSKALDNVIIQFFDVIPWSRLHRLSLTGNTLIEEVLRAFRTTLSSLYSLRLEAVWWGRPAQGTFQSFQTHVRNRPGEGIWSASRSVVTQASSLLREQAFEELKLEGFDSTLSLSDILSPKLRKLKLHIVRAAASLRPQTSRGTTTPVQARTEY